MSAQISDALKAKAFVTGGNCRFTLVSLKTGARYTYKVMEAKDKPGFYFVSLLTGADNESDYTYLGVLADCSFRTTAKTTYRADSAPVMAFGFMAKALFMLSTPVIPLSLQIWHEGRCARCNRALTVPASIESGFGPECTKAA